MYGPSPSKELVWPERGPGYLSAFESPPTQNQVKAVPAIAAWTAMKEVSSGDTLRLSPRSELKGGPSSMLHAGLDLSRRKLDVCLLSASGELVEQLAPAPDADALRTIARRIDEVYGEPVCSVTWSMTGARLVHDTLEQEGWDVEIADAQKVKGLAPLACKTDKIDSLVLAVLSQRDLVPAIWLPTPGCGRSASWLASSRSSTARRPLLLVVQANVWSDGPSALATNANAKATGLELRSVGSSFPARRCPCTTLTRASRAGLSWSSQASTRSVTTLATARAGEQARHGSAFVE
jgi:Transposase